MAEQIQFAAILPPPPAKIFCVGIGGIGVSGLAQLLIAEGYSVAGSDRGLDDPAKEKLYTSLRAQGIRLYPQDGSGIQAEQPAALVISTAVEPGNPDLVAAGDTPVIHRARALAQAIRSTGAIQIAVAGSCGKTSVTGWIASALHSLGQAMLMVNGGYCLEFEGNNFPGNFACARMPRFAVIEVDESDKSLCEFSPDYGVLLNIGNDHYSKEELQEVFGGFLKKCAKGIVVLDDLRPLAEGCRAAVSSFAPVPAYGAIYPTSYAAGPDGIAFNASGFGKIRATQSGHHSALNACAVLTLLKALCLPLPDSALAHAIASFKGIRQRFEIMGRNSRGVPAVNDYAHNPEKLAAAIQTARERFGSPLMAAFQPHGFKPLDFMREALADTLQNALKPGDTLFLLPVYYAGGTSSFTPTSDDVARELAAKGIPVKAATREEAASQFAKAEKPACILVMGARDASLRTWTLELTNA